MLKPQANSKNRTFIWGQQHNPHKKLRKYDGDKCYRCHKPFENGDKITSRVNRCGCAKHYHTNCFEALYI
jgi:hypothetical protein